MKVRRVGVRRVWDCMLCAYMDRGEDVEDSTRLACTKLCAYHGA